MQRRLLGRRLGGNTAAAPERTQQRFAIVVDGRVLSLPRVNSLQAPDGLSGANGAQISGLKRDQVRDRAAELAAGPLPQKLAGR